VKSASRVRLRRAIADKHFNEVERLSKEMKPEGRRLLLAVCSGTVATADLVGDDLDEILGEIEAAKAALDGVDVSVSLDDVHPESSYYTGIRFKLFDPSGRVEIGQGGRYDNLYGEFGSPVPAVGFTLSLDRLEALR
jgi:ATP phosphoribosyltransferase regulatory subunit